MAKVSEIARRNRIQIACIVTPEEAMNYRCLFEASIDIEAESEEDAQRKAAEALCAGLRDDPDMVIVWPLNPKPLEKCR